MAMLELPHTGGCLVCGRDNVLGLRLSLFVDDATGVVRVDYVPRPEHIGFTGIVHGGALATILDEAMVWAATWHGRRFCVAGEMNVRFRHSAGVGMPLVVEARVEQARSRLIRTRGTVTHDGRLVCESTGSYVPMPPDVHAAVVATFVREPATEAAAARFT